MRVVVTHLERKCMFALTRILPLVVFCTFLASCGIGMPGTGLSVPTKESAAPTATSSVQAATSSATIAPTGTEAATVAPTRTSTVIAEQPSTTTPTETAVAPTSTSTSTTTPMPASPVPASTAQPTSAPAQVNPRDLLNPNVPPGTCQVVTDGLLRAGRWYVTESYYNTVDPRFPGYPYWSVFSATFAEQDIQLTTPNDLEGTRIWECYCGKIAISEATRVANEQKAAHPEKYIGLVIDQAAQIEITLP